MWIIIPLIYFMSWRTCRRFGQALNETVAWTAGYLGTAGLILFLDYGGVGMISATPDDPGAAIAIIGGFVGMAISRYLWKRRGGHLEQTSNRWTRTFRALRGEGKPKQPAAKSAATGKQRVTTTTAKPRAAATTPERSTTSSQTKSSSQKKTTQRNTAAYKWGRAIGAMLDSDQPKNGNRR